MGPGDRWKLAFAARELDLASAAEVSPRRTAWEGTSCRASNNRSAILCYCGNAKKMRLFVAITCYPGIPGRGHFRHSARNTWSYISAPPESIRPRLQPQGTTPRQYAPRPGPRRRLGGRGTSSPFGRLRIPRPGWDEDSGGGRDSGKCGLRRARFLPVLGPRWTGRRSKSCVGSSSPNAATTGAATVVGKVLDKNGVCGSIIW
jgi:hypothetical protein